MDWFGMDWKELVGKKIRIWFDDGDKIASKIIVVEGTSDTTIFYENGNGISFYRVIRHEVLE
jgi:hypothetical protein